MVLGASTHVPVPIPKEPQWQFLISTDPDAWSGSDFWKLNSVLRDSEFLGISKVMTVVLFVDG